MTTTRAIRAAHAAVLGLAVAACGREPVPDAARPGDPATAAVPGAAAAPSAGGHESHAGHATAAAGAHDSAAFAALQARGQTAMGVDQYTSTHRFEALPDGGRIVLQRDGADAAGEATIRAHLREVAARFAAGDFAVPAFVHAGAVPGAEGMAARRGAIAYAVRDLPRGGEVRITTRDPAAVAAVHEFLAFQRTDHRAGGGTH